MTEDGAPFEKTPNADELAFPYIPCVWIPRVFYGELQGCIKYSLKITGFEFVFLDVIGFSEVLQIMCLFWHLRQSYLS